MKKPKVLRDDKDLFAYMVKDGLTRQELRHLIATQPARWGQFADQVDKLPLSGRVPACGPTNSGSLRYEPRSKATANDKVDRRVQRVMARVDHEGRPPLTRADWISMLKKIRSECQSRLDAAREDELRGRSAANQTEKES